MATYQCPGQDRRFWKPKDIFDLRCPYCDKHIEFWKDDPSRTCPSCGQTISNPRIDLGCAKWCKYAEECLGVLPNTSVAEAPVIDRLTAFLEKQLRGEAARLKFARGACGLAETIMKTEGGEPRVVKAAALLAGILMAENGDSAAANLETPPFQEPLARQTVLRQAGIDAATVNKICTLVDAILDQATQETIEFAVVWDAIQLQRLHDSGAPSLTPESITHSVKTRSGQQMAGQLVNV